MPDSSEPIRPEARDPAPLDDELDPVQLIFLRARSLPDEERRSWVEDHVPTPEGRRELLELLAADALADEDADGAGPTLAGVLDRGLRELGDELAAANDAGERPASTFEPLEGRTIGRYRIGPRLGEGGFAVVHQAEQLEPVRRTVAIKVLKPGMDSAAVLARFDAERQALAVMEHPGIARVLDGGVTDAGRPYFVMERVRGAPITRAADAAGLDVAARLELFARVCDAVQHAHQKGVVHRDLKPGNILVEDGPEGLRPRVIDFGIAKALEAPLIDTPAATRAGQLVGTPGYMSPEQVLGGGRDVDTRADVHALGVVLHEMLVGCLPVDVPPMASLADLAALAARTRFDRASERFDARSAETAAATARARGTDPAGLRRRLRRDLDWICLTAIAADRDRRYASVSGLAADVRRSLAGELVAAGPPTLAYRATTFLRRRRREVAVAVLLVLTLAIAAGGMAVQAAAAARARDEQTAVAGFLDQFILSASPFATVGDDADDGGTRTDVLQRRLEDASFLVTSELASWPAAQAQVRLTLARALQGLGATDAAAREAQIAITLGREHVGPRSRLVFDAIGVRGRCLWQTTQTEEAIALLEPGLAAARLTLGPDDASTLTIANNLALAYRGIGREEEARAIHRDTLARREQALGPEHADTVISRSNYARALQAAGELEPARTLQEAVLAAHRRQLGDDHPETLVTLDQLGTLLGDLGRDRDAAAMHREAFVGLEATLGPTHETTLGARFYLAGALGRLGDLPAAEAELRAIWTICRAQFGEDDRYATTSLISLAETVRQQGRPAEAARLVSPALERALAADGWSYRQTWALARTLAIARQDEGRHGEAGELLDRAIDASSAQLRPEDLRFVELLVHRAVSHAATGRVDQARPVLRDGVDALLSAGKRSSPALSRGLGALARVQALDGDAGGAARSRAVLEELTRGG